MLIHTGQATRRVDLTEQLGLTRSATGAVLRELEGLTLVRSSASLPSTPAVNIGTGRPSHAVEIHPEAATALAVQVQAETLLLAEVGFGSILGTVTELPLLSSDPHSVLTLAVDHLDERLSHARHSSIGIGVALPSAVDVDGTALAALNLAWPHAVPVRSDLRRLLAARGHSTPVYVGNDANLAALAEARHGAGRGAGDLLYMMTGQRGVGGGLVVNGRLHTGSIGYALEIGHLTVNPRGRPCHCGSVGCLEVETDPVALLEAAGVAATGPVLTAARSVIASASTSPTARAAVDAVTEYVGAGLASLINVLNPDLIVLGGLHADLLRARTLELQAVLTRRSFLDQAAQVEIRAGTLTHPSLTGAAELALQPVLTNPRHLLRSNGPSPRHPTPYGAMARTRLGGVFGAAK
jgi:predicted NBD/HSP70 family sugar kinase